ncbi:uncharacterized protein [Garra rufa]|uniref:uncharacterized protein n=1 Tax=Garra rufa TaxID=137080 RepID=UPI003CCED73D
MSAYLAALYGHRGGVFQNMLIKEVEEAKDSESEHIFLINIMSHKTNQVFGPAQIALTREEYGWMERFLAIRKRLPGGKTAKYFFFTSTTNICKKLITYFREAWKSMGLPGNPSFTDIRSSIASHAKFTHSEDGRMKIAKFMCHDVQTADRFYVTNLSTKQAIEHRMLFEAALQGVDISSAGVKRQRHRRKMERPRKRGKASEGDSGDTSGSPEKSPETNQGEEGLSETDDPGQSGEDSGTSSHERSPVPSPTKTPVVVITPMRRKLRPRRISPTSIQMVKKIAQMKKVKNKVKRAILKRKAKK